MNDDASGRKARAKTQFNTVAAEYDAGPGCFAHFGRRLVSAAKIQSGQRVLDVASGRGAVLFPNPMISVRPGVNCVVGPGRRPSRPVRHATP